MSAEVLARWTGRAHGRPRGHADRVEMRATLIRSPEGRRRIEIAERTGRGWRTRRRLRASDEAVRMLRRQGQGAGR